MLCLALLGIVSALLLRDDRDRHFLGVERLSKIKIIETQGKPKLDKKVPVDPNYTYIIYTFADCMIFGSDTSWDENTQFFLLP